MKRSTIGALAVGSTLLSPIAATAQTEVHFWHAFTGRLGELVAAQVDEFNASQDDYVVVQNHKGNQPMRVDVQHMAAFYPSGSGRFSFDFVP